MIEDENRSVAARTPYFDFQAIFSRILSLDWQIVLLILAIKVVILMFGVQSYQSISNQPVSSFYGWFEIWARWDANHYLDIARYGYTAEGERNVQIVFFPLFPSLTSFVAFFVRDVLISAFIVSGVASIATGLFLRKLVQLDYPNEVSWSAVWFLFIFPTSYFLHIPYTESLFLALSIGCFYAARTERWLLAGLLGQLACLCRFNGIILFPALLVELLLLYKTSRKFDLRWLWILFIPTGFILYLLINYYVMGDMFAFASIQKDHWFKYLTWPWVGVQGKYGTFISSSSPAESQMVGYQELFFIMLGALATVWCLLKLRYSYGVWMILNWIIFVSTSWILSVPRYTLIMFPIYIMFADLSSKRPWVAGFITTWSILFLALFSSLFVWGHWAF